MRWISYTCWLALSLLGSVELAADASDLVGFNIDVATQKLRAYGHAAAANKLESLEPDIEGFEVRYVFAADQLLYPGKYGEEGAEKHQLYGLASADIPKWELDSLVWTTVEGGAGVLNALRNYAPLLTSEPRDVVVLNASDVRTLRRIFDFNKSIEDGARLTPGPIDELRRGIPVEEIPWPSERSPIVMVGFMGPQVHAYAVPESNSRWRPALTRLWAEERERVAAALKILDGQSFPYRIIVSTRVAGGRPSAPVQENNEHVEMHSDAERRVLLSQMAEAVRLRFRNGDGAWGVTPSQRQVLGDRIVISGFLDAQSIEADEALLVFGDADLTAVNGFNVVRELDLLQSDRELVQTVLRLGPLASRSPHLLQHAVDFADLGPSDVANFLELSNVRSANRDRRYPPAPSVTSRTYRSLAEKIERVDLQLHRLIGVARYLKEQKISIREILVLRPRFQAGQLARLLGNEESAQQDYVYDYLDGILEIPLRKGEMSSPSPEEANVIRIIFVLG